MPKISANFLKNSTLNSDNNYLQFSNGYIFQFGYSKTGSSSFAAQVITYQKTYDNDTYSITSAPALDSDSYFRETAQASNRAVSRAFLALKTNSSIAVNMAQNNCSQSYMTAGFASGDIDLYYYIIKY